jgi:hypothetical protein
MVTEGPPVERDAFDHIGIERALGEELRAAFLGFGSKTSMNSLADELALGLGIGDAGERAEEGFAASTWTSGML